ncbi:MAG TPA: hypothetical protein VL334_26155, partial [Anaerolineae bacterium]|nr:hypothetical protein [Anaerolineae bacterium]
GEGCGRRNGARTLRSEKRGMSHLAFCKWNDCLATILPQTTPPAEIIGLPGLTLFTHIDKRPPI